MKPKNCSLTGLMTVFLTLPAGADVIYSNLQNIAIPADFGGVYLNVETGQWNTDINSPQAGWDINPFYGGSVLWNSPTFQPVRGGATEMSTVLNLAEGTSVGGGSQFSTFVQQAGGENVGGPGYGASLDHLGALPGQFQAGSEGYVGFRLNGDKYGWMRVVFTDNAGGALIKDWAYDSGGGAIATGNVLQNGSTVTLNSTFGSFTLGSQIGGGNSVVKTGDNTAILTGVNTYTGTTTVNQGSLLVNGSITGGGNVSVAGAATLGGTGSLTGALNVSGVLSPGASIESFSSGALTMNAGSKFVYEATDSGSTGADLMVVNGDLSLTDVELDLGGANLGLNTWALNDKLTLISYTGPGISGGFTGYANNSVHTGGIFGTNEWKLVYDDPVPGGNFPLEATGSKFVTFTVVPEPGTVLLGGLGLLALLRRRRD